MLWFMFRKIKIKIQGLLVNCQFGLGGTLRIKPLTWSHGSNFGSPRIWVVTCYVKFDCCFTISWRILYVNQLEESHVKKHHHRPCKGACQSRFPATMHSMSSFLRKSPKEESFGWACTWHQEWVTIRDHHWHLRLYH